MESLLESSILFLEKTTKLIEDVGIDISISEIDHICYRVASLAKYTEMKSLLSEYGTLLVEGMISGRPISTFLLFHPIVYKQWNVSCVELPCPKAGSHYDEGCLKIHDEIFK